MILNPHIDKDITETYWLRWTRPPDVARYDIITPAGKHVQAGPNAIEAKLGKGLTEPVIASIAPIFNSDYERAEFPRPPQSIAIGVPTAGASGVAVFDKVVVGGGTSRVDLKTKASSIDGMLSWLASNPQPALVPPGSYSYATALHVPAGVDLLFDRVALLPANPNTSMVQVAGSGTKLTFQGLCRLGAAGSKNARLDNGETDGIQMWGASNWTVHADDLTIEGVRNTGFACRRTSSHGVVTGKITCIHTGADSFHVTQGANFLDFSGATFVANGGGDDMFPVVSYAEDGALCHDIHWGTCIGRDCPARGMAVVGCSPTVTMDSLDVDGCDAAGIYIACEPSYITYGVDGVLVKAAKLRNVSRVIHNANVLFYSGRSGYSLKNTAVTVNDPDTTKALWRKTGSYGVSNCTVNGQVVS